MTRATFFKQFGELAETPDAVAKIRKATVRMAISGGLVRQNAADEPVSKTAQKLKLAQPETKPVPTAIRTWERWLMVELLDIQYGFAFESSRFVETNEGMPLIRIRDLNSTTTVVRYVGEYSEEYVVENGDYLVGMDGDFNLRQWKGGRALLNQRVCRLHNFSPIVEPAFAVLAIQEQLDAIHAETSYVTVKHLSAKQLNATWLDIPPLAEQRRIVAKVDELMALCSELAARQQARHGARAQLQQSALHHLLAAREPHTFAPAWQRVRDHFHLLHDTPDALPQLRQAILQLAVQGRLVPQNPKDEPAAALLEAIQAEEEQRAKDRGKERKPLPAIAPDEKPYTLPSGWEWARLGSLGNTNIGLTYSPKDISDDGTPVLRANSIKDGKLNLADLVRVRIKVKENVLAREGDLLICARSGSRSLVGKCALIGKLQEQVAFGAFMAIFRSRLNSYIFHFASSPLFRRMIDEVNTTTINQITQDNLRTTLIAVPPMAEQKRIVARVEALLRQCDALEAQLRQTRTLGAHLLDSTLHHLLAA